MLLEFDLENQMPLMPESFLVIRLDVDPVDLPLHIGWKTRKSVWARRLMALPQPPSEYHDTLKTDWR